MATASDDYSISLDTRGLQTLIDKIQRSMGPTNVKKGLRPAAKMIQKSIRRETRVGSNYSPFRPAPGRLKKSIKIKAIRDKPVMLVAAVREAALSQSMLYEQFPYVNWIVGDNKSALGDKFIDRGFRKVEFEAIDEAIDGLKAIIRKGSLGRIFTR